MNNSYIQELVSRNMGILDRRQSVRQLPVDPRWGGWLELGRSLAVAVRFVAKEGYSN